MNIAKPMDFSSRDIDICCADKRVLRATLFEPSHHNRYVVQINSALGVPRRFYQRIAQHLAAMGCVVLTFDYRGVGDSQDRKLVDDATSFRDWGEHDINAVIQYLTQRYANYQLVGIGHSAGGALLGLAENCDRFDTFLSIAAPSAYWRNWSFPYNLYLMPFWHFFVPVLPRLMGYFPGDLFGMGNLPKQVVLQWRRFAMHKDYIVDEQGAPLRQHYHRLNAAMRFVHLSDDALYAPRASVEHLASFYQKADRHVVTYYPEQCQQKALGHFGYFRQSAQPLWNRDFAWLLGHQNVHQ